MSFSSVNVYFLQPGLLQEVELMDNSHDIIYGLAEVALFLTNQCGRTDYSQTIEDACSELSEHRWIPVSERFPDEEEAVEIWLKYDKIVFTAYLHKEWWVVCGTWGEKEFAKHEVSHWRKPQPPQEG